MRLKPGFVLLAAAIPGLASAATPPCLTSGEFTALTTYALPSVISGAAQRCATQLPADAYLKRSGADLAARYSQRKGVSWPAAKAAFLKLSAGTNAEANNVIRTLPDASMQPMLDALMTGMVSQRLPLERCVAVDRVIGLLAPLPPESTAELIALAVGLGSRAGGGKVGAISLCPA